MSTINILWLTVRMNFFKRAVTSIVRRPSSTITLLLLVFILGSVIAGTISVSDAIRNTDANLRRNMQPILSIEMDSQSWNEYWREWIENDDFDWENANINDPLTFPSNQPQFQPLTAPDVRTIGALEYVNDFDYIMQTILHSFDLNQYVDDRWEGFEEGELRWFDVKGTSDTNLMQIDQGTLVLVQGNQFSQNDLIPGQVRSSAIISEAFAQTNNLTIGSIFSLYDFVMYPNEYKDTSGWGRTEDYIYAQIGMEFEVIGLFDIPTEPDAKPDPWGLDPRMDHINSIYIPNWAIEDILARTHVAQLSVWETVDMDIPFWMDDEHEALITPLFVLENPADIDNFKAVATQLLPPHHHFVDLSSTFNDITVSMQMMQNTADWILYVSIGAMLLILSLSITLFLRERRYEMGVYLALGEKRGRIIGQVLTEVVVTSFVAITLAVFAGNLISSMISQNMLENELVAQYQQNREDAIWGEGEWLIFDRIGITTTTMTPEEMMEVFEVSISIQIIGLFYVIGLATVVLSTVASLMYVVTLNPKKVFMN